MKFAANRVYKGWWIYGTANAWMATRFGVRMRGNSEELLIRMIDLREAIQ